VTECNLARNTQRSYRDTRCLLIPFVAQHVRKEVDQISVIDVSSDVVRLFLQHLEECRNVEWQRVTSDWSSRRDGSSFGGRGKSNMFCACVIWLTRTRSRIFAPFLSPNRIIIEARGALLDSVKSSIERRLRFHS
jgi:hypothetical protein